MASGTIIIIWSFNYTQSFTTWSTTCQVLVLTLSPPINFLKAKYSAPPISMQYVVNFTSMQYVVNFTSMQYVLISVDTGTEGMLSTIVTCGIKQGGSQEFDLGGYKC